MIVRYWPFTDCCRMPSDAEPYSPEIGAFAPFAVCGRVNVPTEEAEPPPAPSWNSCSTIGDAVSSPPVVPLQTEEATVHETVLMTRSPGVNDEMFPARAGPSEAWTITPIARTAKPNFVRV